MDRMSINEVEVTSLSSTLDIHSTLTVPLKRYAKYALPENWLHSLLWDMQNMLV